MKVGILVILNILWIGVFFAESRHKEEMKMKEAIEFSQHVYAEWDLTSLKEQLRRDYNNPESIKMFHIIKETQRLQHERDMVQCQEKLDASNKKR